MVPYRIKKEKGPESISCILSRTIETMLKVDWKKSHRRLVNYKLSWKRPLKVINVTTFSADFSSEESKWVSMNHSYPTIQERVKLLKPSIKTLQQCLNSVQSFDVKESRTKLCLCSDALILSWKRLLSY